MNTTISVSTTSSRKISIVKVLLVCGIVSSCLYVAMNILVAMQFRGYSSTSQTISELSAIGSPTRTLWVGLGIVYTLLVAAFGWGIWKSTSDNRSLRIVGGLLVAYGIIGLGWPLAPMHQREVLAAGGGTMSDTMHIVFSMVTVLLMLLAMAFGISELGKGFRSYSIVTILMLVVLGAVTALDAPKLQRNEATPWLGVWERIMVGLFLLWVVVLAIKLLRKQNKKESNGQGHVWTNVLTGFTVK